MAPVTHYLIVSAILFSLGVFGVLVRRNVIIIFMCIELMLNAVNLTFVALARYLGNIDGQIFSFMTMTVAAAEEAAGGAVAHELGEVDGEQHVEDGVRPRVGERLHDRRRVDAPERLFPCYSGVRESPRMSTLNQD